MRPLRELPELRVRELRGIFCDIDDTLTTDGILVPAAYQALARAKASGLRVVPVTGRPAGFAAVLAASWPVDAVVAENGAVRCERRGPAIETIFWDDEEARARAKDALATIRADVLAHVPRARVAWDEWLRLTDLAFDIGETQTLDADEIAAITTRIEAAGARALVSTVHAHASFSLADKAQAAARLAHDLFGEPPETVAERYLFVGDSPNDQAGFAFFTLSAGPANVARYAAALAPPPSYVAESPGGEGFSEIVDAILALRVS